MTLTYGTMYFRRLAVLVVTAAGLAGVSHAQAPPYALTQYANLTGSGDTITAAWVPVVTTSGTVLKNVTLLFEVDAAGNLTIAPGYPKVVPVQPPIVTGFKNGPYHGPGTVLSGLAKVNVAGPG